MVALQVELDDSKSRLNAAAGVGFAGTSRPSPCDGQHDDGALSFGSPRRLAPTPRQGRRSETILGFRPGDRLQRRALATKPSTGATAGQRRRPCRSTSPAPNGTAANRPRAPPGDAHRTRARLEFKTGEAQHRSDLEPHLDSTRPAGRTVDCFWPPVMFRADRHIENALGPLTCRLRLSLRRRWPAAGRFVRFHAAMTA